MTFEVTLYYYTNANIKIMRNWEVFILVNEKFFDRPNKRNQNHIGRKTFAITTLCMGSILCLGMHTHDAEAAEMPNAPVEHETQIESTGDQTKENRDSIPENQRQKLPNTQTRAPEATSLKQGDVSSEQVSNHQMAQTSQPQRLLRLLGHCLIWKLYS